MDEFCIILTAEGDLKSGICCAENPDFVRDPLDPLHHGRTGFRIGCLPEDITGKSILLYVEDEEIYRRVSRNWVD